MNCIIYYSNTNQSKLVAEYFKEKLSWNIYDLNNPKERNIIINEIYETTVIVFPVYCQSVPDFIKKIIKNIKSKYIIPIATYGKMCYGNALFNFKKYYKNRKIIAAAYVPMNHSYLNEKEVTYLSKLDLVIEKINNNNLTEIIIKKSYKNIFAPLLKDLRSRMLVKMDIDLTKCINCGKCEKECIYEGIKNHKFNKKCIRCLKCKTNCPANAITHKNRYILKKYLNKTKQEDFLVFI